MDRVLIIGAGGHAQVVGDILLRVRDAGGGLSPVGFLDDAPQLARSVFLGLPVLGMLADQGSIAHHLLIVALGDNHTRMKLAHRFTVKSPLPPFGKGGLGRIFITRGETIPKIHER